MSIVKGRFTTKPLPHPNFPSFISMIRNQTEIEALDFVATLQEHVIALAVKDPDTKEFLKNEDGSFVIHVKQNFPPQHILRMLRGIFMGWTGLTDEDENGIEFDVPFDNGANMYYLFKPDLNVTLPNPKFTPDSKLPETIEQPYWQWISNTIKEKGFWLRDPKVTR